MSAASPNSVAERLQYVAPFAERSQAITSFSLFFPCLAISLSAPTLKFALVTLLGSLPGLLRTPCKWVQLRAYAVRVNSRSEQPISQFADQATTPSGAVEASRFRTLILFPYKLPSLSGRQPAVSPGTGMRLAIQSFGSKTLCFFRHRLKDETLEQSAADTFTDDLPWAISRTTIVCRASSASGLRVVPMWTVYENGRFETTDYLVVSRVVAYGVLRDRVT